MELENKKIKKFIQRKTLIYKTRVEYGDYTMNHVLGCAHGCKFPCYAYLLKKRFAQITSYEEWCEPVLVENTMELLEKELPIYKTRIKMLHLCFTTDPFMYLYPEVQNMSIAAIKKINSYDIPCSVLTKGILPTELSKFSSQNEYGITLVSLDKLFRNQMEPGSAPYNDRVNALYQLHKAGCKTWVSIEPYPTPNIIQQDIIEILDKVSFVDKIIFGRMNYNKNVSNYEEHKNFYNEKANEVIKFCQKKNIDFYIKNKTIT